METELINKSRAYALSTLSQLPKDYVYHNLKHTEQVASAAEEIGKHSNLTADELEIAIIAAWMHDTGYCMGCDDHEHNSAMAAQKLLEQWGAPKQKIEQVTAAISATEMPQKPKNLTEKVLCDADLYHLSTDDLTEIANGLRQEMYITKKKEFTDDEWFKFNIDFLENHQYFTDYGKSVLEERKKKNIKKLKKRANKANGLQEAQLTGEGTKAMKKELKKLRKKLDKSSRPDRGIETMFRITSQNHITLSEMADSKANIMVSINAIVLSVIVSILFRKLEEFPDLLIATLMLVTSCLMTIVYAVLATRPNISSGKFTTEDIKQKRTNLLFFGNFHGMELANYEWGVREMMKDADFLYGSIIKDIYFNGKVLARKYKLLHISYNIFMYGFVASIIAFILSLLMFYYPE